MILVSPASYLSVAAFKAQPNDYDLSGYSDTQLTDLLVRASGRANAIMRKSYLASEKTVRYIGDGTNRLTLLQSPVLYVKRAQIVSPVGGGTFIPTAQLLVDYNAGFLTDYTPLLIQGNGYFASFPSGIPVDVTLAHGYGYSVAPPPWTSADSPAGGLAPGAYNLAVTSKTMWGESSAVVQQVTTASGSFVITPNPVLGAYVYRAFISPAAHNTTLNGATAIGATSFTLASAALATPGAKLLFDTGANAEVLTVASVAGSVVTTTGAALYGHANGSAVIPLPTLVAESPYTAYGASGQTIAVDSLVAASGMWPDPLPTTDTSAAAVPNAMIEAVRLLALDMLWAQNNLANRGVMETQSGKKSVRWRSTEGNSGRGVSYTRQEAETLLAPFAFRGVF
jgi:hypothetical protein